MIISQLQAGDRFAQNLNGSRIDFEVVTVRPAGMEYEVTFRSKLGEDTARYAARACLVTDSH